MLTTALATILASALGCSPGSNGEGNAVEATTSALSQSGFRGWQQIPGQTFGSSPAAVSLDSSTVSVFGKGGDNNYWQNFGFTFDGGSTWSWTGWTSTDFGGMLFDCAPGATGFNTEDIAVAGIIDSTVYVNVNQRDSSGSLSWTGWAPLPLAGDFLSMGVALTYSSSYLYAFAPGWDYKLYWTRNDVSGGYNSANWSTWTKLSESTTDCCAFGAAALPGGQIFVGAQLQSDSQEYV
ncbi:MAG TPA: hypothetical protein VK989_10150, partial [Polyangia bacterium]|nr:hypothetical protein [Polyangia bacterium]